MKQQIITQSCSSHDQIKDFSCNVFIENLKDSGLVMTIDISNMQEMSLF